MGSIVVPAHLQQMDDQIRRGKPTERAGAVEAVRKLGAEGYPLVPALGSLLGRSALPAGLKLDAQRAILAATSSRVKGGMTHDVAEQLRGLSDLGVDQATELAGLLAMLVEHRDGCVLCRSGGV